MISEKRQLKEEDANLAYLPTLAEPANAPLKVDVIAELSVLFSKFV